MKKPVLTLSLSCLLLASCGPAPQTPTTPSPTPTPTPSPSAPVFQGQTTLTGTVALDAQSVVVEAANASGTFRKSTAASNKTYSISGVPVGERIRVQAQYVNNRNVILSALIEPGVEQKEKTTSLDVNAETTAVDLIYSRAATQNKSKIVAMPVADFMANAAIKPYRDQVLGAINQILATPIDAILVNLPTAPTVVQTIDAVLPLIDATLANQPLPSASPTASPSVTPSGQPTPVPTPTSTAFAPVRLLVKPGTDLTIARDTSLRLWVAGVDANGQQQTVTPTWVTNSGAGAIGPDGVFSPPASGNYTFTASLGSLSTQVTVHVTDADLREIKMVPDNDFTLNVGQNFEFTAKGTDKQGRDVIVTPNWSLSNNINGQIDANGVFTPLQSGRVDVTARAREFSSTHTITVEAASSFLFDVSPAMPVVLTGKQQAVQVLALDLVNNTSAVAFSFSVSDTNVGSFVNQDTSINGITSTAVFQANKPGTTQVTVKDIISGRTSTFPITVADGVPFISGIAPANTPLSPGQTVTITGLNFAPSATGNQVLFNNQPGTVLSATPTALNVSVPLGAFTGMITVVSNGQRGGSYPFVITPQLNNLIPAEGNEGDLITITGSNFSTDNPAHNAVYFDAVRANIPQNVTSASLQVRVPSNLTASPQVSVRVKGQISNFVDFTVSGASLPTWTTKRDAPTPRSGAMAEVISGSVYMVGGFSATDSKRLDIYNVSDDTWSSGTNLPVESSNLTTATLDDDLYAIGGSGASTSIYRYTRSDNTWRNLQVTSNVTMKNAHVGAVAEAYNGKLYIIGGSGSDGRIVEECKPGGDADPNKSCVLKQNSPTRRFDAASALYNGRIYVFGGGEDTTEDRVSAYNIADDKWETGLAPMPKALRRCRATILSGKIYVIGGRDSAGVESDSVFEYDPSGDKWRTLRKLPSGRSGAAVAGISSKLFVIGGDNTSGTSQSSNYRGQL